jgi:nucleoid DNA-binding protein
MLKGVSVNKSDLVEILSAEHGLTKKDAAAVLDTVLDSITRSVVAGDPVALAGFGTFKKQATAARAARVGRNPQTGAEVKIAAKKASFKAAFSPAKQLKEYVTGAVKLPKKK